MFRVGHARFGAYALLAFSSGSAQGEVSPPKRNMHRGVVLPAKGAACLI
jgi:hypothetical protein